MIDVLGHPITVGSTVLTNGYYVTTMNTITVVEKVTKKAVYVTVNTYLPKKKLMRKYPYQILVIEKQLNHNKETYPENFI